MTPEDKLRFDAFVLGITLMLQVWDLDVADERQRRIFSTLREVANGQLTLLDSPADVASTPGLPEHVVRDWWENMGDWIESDRTQAASILKVYDELMGDSAD